MSPQTVSSESILFMCVSLFICVGAPVGFIIWGKIKYKKAFSFIPMLLGAAGFFVFQIVIRALILLPLVQSIGWVRSLLSNPINNVWFLWIYAAFLAITAGLFEEPVRFAVYAILKKKRQFPNGLSYGIGHGGIEAIVLIGLSYYLNYIIYSLAINNGTWGAMISALPTAQQAAMATVGQQLLTTPPWAFVIGGLERLFTMFIQIALSLVVLKGFILNKKWLYLLLAIGLHTLVDFPAALYQLGILKINPLMMEGIVLVEAVVALLYIIKQAKGYRNSLAEAGAVPETETEPETLPE